MQTILWVSGEEELTTDWKLELDKSLTSFKIYVVVSLILFKLSTTSKDALFCPVSLSHQAETAVLESDRIVWPRGVWTKGSWLLFLQLWRLQSDVSLRKSLGEVYYYKGIVSLFDVWAGNRALVDFAIITELL